MSARTAGLAYAGLTVSIFAGWFVVTRFAVTHSLNTADVAVLRFGIGLVCLAPALRGLPARAWRDGAAFAALWGVPFVLVLGFGLQRNSAAEAASVTPTLMPVFAGLLGWAVLRQRPGRRQLWGYAAIVAGIAASVAALAAGSGMPDGPGFAALLGASAMWAVYTLLFRRGGMSPVQAAALICFWSTLGFLPVYLGFGLGRMGSAPWPELLVQAGYQGVLMSALGIVCFNRAVVLLGARAASAIIALLPVIATVLAVPALGEVPGPATLAALAVIAAGVLLAAGPSPLEASRQAR